MNLKKIIGLLLCFFNFLGQLPIAILLLKTGIGLIEETLPKKLVD